MVTYRVHQKQLSDTLQAQFIYENSPVFAGTDDFSILVRLKYTGDRTKTTAEKPKLNDPFKKQGNSEHIQHDKNVKVNTEIKTKQEFRWFSNRFSAQLSNATRSIFLHSLNSPAEWEKSTLSMKAEKETLFLGYCQILGHYSINETIIDYSIFKDVQKSTIIEGKYAGVQGLNAPLDSDNDGTGILAGLSYLYNTELNSFADSSLAENLKFIPFYSSAQNIIFSELEIDPKELNHAENDVKSFLITCKLPKELPPTYMTESVQINYNFILGYQTMDGINVQSKTVFVPLKIQPFVIGYGKQPIYHLENAMLNVNLEKFAVKDVSNHPSLFNKTSSTENVAANSRRISFWNLKKNTNLKSNDEAHVRSSMCNSVRSSKSIIDLSSVAKLDDKVLQFMDTLEKLDTADINDIVKVQEEFEKEQNTTKSFKFNVKENLMQLLTGSNYAQKHKSVDTDFDSDLDYDYLLPKEQQNKYIIKQNHTCISTIKLNKAVFKLGDCINMHIDFEQNHYATTGVEFQLLKHQVFKNNEYLKKGAYDEISPRLDQNTLETILFQKMMSTFNTLSINADIFIPTETESQFKTNFFTCRYYIQVRFITVSRIRSSNKSEDNIENEPSDQITSKSSINCFKNIFVDSNGSMLFRAKERMSNANEFYIRIPIVVLPTYEQDFGILTIKT